MPDESFEKLEVWRRSDSAESISANIAEGTERNTKPEFRQFLGYAKGSAGETRSRLYIAERVGYIPPADCVELLDELRRISRMIKGLTDSLK